MIDSEVQRLRDLRASALRVRAIAHALGRRFAGNDALLNRGACAAWRIARAVSGRLRAHPFLRFQRDASLSVLIANSLAAKSAGLRAANLQSALQLFDAQLKMLARELADARALTWVPELSDSFGRSQAEIRSLTAALGFETQVIEPEKPRLRSPETAPIEDWPYLAL
jgi:hypothetical protein